jgi:hypothetical protein
MAYKRKSPMPVVEGGTGAQTLTGVCIGNGTSAITGNAVTQYNALIGGASNAITSVAPSATSGVPLISQGAASNPAFGTAVVAGGGTGVTSNTAYAVLCGGTTSTNPIQSIASVGTSGHILTSNGAGALPTFQVAPATGVTSIAGDTGGAQSGPAITFAGGTTGLSFGGAANTITTTFAGITANGGTVSLATDATASTINVGTGAGVKTTTLGSTNSTSSTAIKSGTGNVAVNSGLTIDSTGRNYNTVQPAFLAYLASTDTNRTGNSTLFTIGSGTALTEVYDQGSNFNTNGTFTAPITGKYMLTGQVIVTGCTIATGIVFQLVTTARTYEYDYSRTASNLNLQGQIHALCDMTAGDTAVLKVLVAGEAADTDDIVGGSTLFTYFSGYLAC